jgi:hypothetical protein
MTYQRGAKGPEVQQIEEKLRAASLYAGPIDAIYGGGLEAAVRRYQSDNHLAATGVVDDETWRSLFGAPPPAPAIASAPLVSRCLALTGSFETNLPVPECFAGLSGDFDGQGLSFGALQWCIGQGSLQVLLRDMVGKQPQRFDAIMGPSAAELRAVLGAPLDQQLQWAKSIGTSRGGIAEPWQGLFKTLGRDEAFQAIEVDHARKIYDSGLGLCRRFGLASERAVALMFDICVQNGGIDQLVCTQIDADLRALPESAPGSTDEVPAMRIVARRRTAAANPRWAQDILARKLTIAEGSGEVHGDHYELDSQYGIRLATASDLAES